ncbi:alpha amylase catalytic region [Clostridium sp. CAG:768]|nr:alpha amylase catalytic region [Clostridium sp. CAG:768]
MINSTNLLTLKLHNLNKTENTTNQTSAVTSPLEKKEVKSGLLNAYLNNMALINTPAVKKVDSAPKVINYHNDLRTLLKNNEAKILAIVPRTFNAKDLNGNDYIDGNEQHGTFLNAIERLDEVKAAGFNTFHVLPVSTPGKIKAMGTAGSVYAPKDMLEIDPMLIDKNDPRSDKEQFKAFIDECHKRGIRVMLDLPSCASYEMFLNMPELMAVEKDGLAKTPQGWNDIRMLQPWEDEGKRTLNPKLLEYHKKFVDMCIDLGIDGIRADVARTKPAEFWDVIIPYSHMRDPEFAWLAETYTYEDASPQANMPHDRPEDSLRAGFDAIYGQYHIFHEWPNATTFMDYVKEQLDMSYRLPKGKSLIGSFATHDDISPMFHGGADYCNLTMGLQATLPMLNPYIVDGYQSGDDYIYSFADKYNPITQTDNHEMTVHRGRLDIFNLSRRPGGTQPEIGKFMTSAFNMRDKYIDVISKGTFIQLDKENDKNDNIIAYARHYNGKTLLVVANKNVNRAVACKIKVPTLKADQELNNLLPSYGKESVLQAKDNELCVDLGPARVHVFEIDTPNIENFCDKIYKQNL